MIPIIVLFFIVIIALLFVLLTRAMSYGLTVFGVIVVLVFLVWMIMEIVDEFGRRRNDEEEW